VVHHPGQTAAQRDRHTRSLIFLEVAMPGSVVEQDGNWQCNLTNEQWQLRKGQKLPSQTHINQDDMLFWIKE
jgi:hypothetical protein